MDAVAKGRLRDTHRQQAAALGLARRTSGTVRADYVNCFVCTQRNEGGATSVLPTQGCHQILVCMPSD